ncbi:hypothetical protein PMAYCL1PPCAC_32147, partial [Pristionchus mayeri]
TDARDQALLRSTWSEDFESLYRMGSRMYLHIFRTNPTIKDLFPWIAQYEKAGHYFTDSPEFRTQALRLVQTLAKVVENVTRLEGVEGYLYKLGHRHVGYLADGLQTQYWTVFQIAMDTLLVEKMNGLSNLSKADRDRAILVWKDVVAYVNYHMKTGYEDGLKGINKYSTGII